MEMTIGANPEAFRTVFRACRKAGRTLVVDLYTDTIAKATGRDSIPRSGFSGLKVYVPQSQRLKVKQSKQFFRVNGLRNHRIYPEQLAQQPGKYAVIFRSSMIRDFRHIDALADGVLVWSLWKGYLDQQSGQRVKDFAASHDLDRVGQLRVICFQRIQIRCCLARVPADDDESIDVIGDADGRA